MPETRPVDQKADMGPFCSQQARKLCKRLFVCQIHDEKPEPGLGTFCLESFQFFLSSGENPDFMKLRIIFCRPARQTAPYAGRGSCYQRDFLPVSPSLFISFWITLSETVLPEAALLEITPPAASCR